MKQQSWEENEDNTVAKKSKKEHFYEIFNISSAQTGILYDLLIFVKIKKSYIPVCIT